MWGHKTESPLQSSLAEEPEGGISPSRDAAQAPEQRVTAASRPATSGASGITRIGLSLRLYGEITGSNDLYIDGEVVGTVAIQGDLIIGTSGSVYGDVSARRITILGHLQGNLRAAEIVDIRGTGTVEGEVVAARISIEEGAVLRGSVDLCRPGAVQEARPAARRAGKGHHFPTDFEAELEFDAVVPTYAAVEVLNALAEYYRACGGLGLELSFEQEQPASVAPEPQRA